MRHEESQSDQVAHVAGRHREVVILVGIGEALRRKTMDLDGAADGPGLICRKRDLMLRGRT